RSRVIIGSLFVWSLVTWLTSLATSFEQLLAARALMGISEACYMPAAMALIMDWHTGKTRSTATGIHVAGVMVGQSLGFIGGWLAETHSWHYAFSIFGIVGIGYAVILVFFLRDPKANTEEETIDVVSQEEQTDFRVALKRLFGNPSFIVVLIIWGIAGAISWMVNGWLPTFYKEKFDLSQTEAG